MAQKFGNGRWVRDGFLDNRTAGTVVGQLFFASVGLVDLYLRGDFKNDLVGQIICLHNRHFEEDELAGHVLGDLEVPQVGAVSLISFDPHPLLAPHPYIEWFSDRENHYRIELLEGDAWVATPEETKALELESARIRATLGGPPQSAPPPRQDSDSEWV